MHAQTDKHRQTDRPTSWTDKKQEILLIIVVVCLMFVEDCVLKLCPACCAPGSRFAILVATIFRRSTIIFLTTVHKLCSMRVQHMVASRRTGSNYITYCVFNSIAIVYCLVPTYDTTIKASICACWRRALHVQTWPPRIPRIGSSRFP